MVYLLGVLVVLLAAALVIVVRDCGQEIRRLERLNAQLAVEAGYEPPSEEWLRMELLRLRLENPSHGNRQLRKTFNRLHRAENGVVLSQRYADFLLNPETRR